MDPDKNEQPTEITIEQRQAIAEKIDECFAKSNLEFYEALLGTCDYFCTILTLELSKVLETPEEREKSQERVNALREPMIEALNKRTSHFLAEDMVVLLSLLTESIIIGIKRQNNIELEK